MSTVDPKSPCDIFSHEKINIKNSNWVSLWVKTNKFFLGFNRISNINTLGR